MHTHSHVTSKYITYMCLYMYIYETTLEIKSLIIENSFIWYEPTNELDGDV